MEKRLGYLIKRVQQALRLRMDNELKYFNLTTAQYAALNALEQTPNASSAELARACFVTPQTMTQIIQRLKTAGFLTRESHPAHGRIIQTVLSGKGQSTLQSAHKVIAKIEEVMIGNLLSKEHEKLVEQLESFYNNLNLK